MLLIGICGKARVGKDTAANYLAMKYCLDKYSFATPIRDMLLAINVDYTDETKELPHPVFGKSPREMMQTLGTEWMRDQVDKNGWLNLAKERFLCGPKGLVIPDVRFNNEAEWIRENGLLIYMHSKKVEEVATHSSENGVQLVSNKDGVLVNDGSIQDLYDQIDETINLRPA